MFCSSKKRRTRAIIAVGALSALLLTGCTAGGTSTGASSGSSKLVVAYYGQLDTLDPVATRTQTGYIDSSVYETLVMYDTKNELKGQLATEYTVAPDAKSISFTLRKGVKFHSGGELTAADVQYTIERYLAIGSGVAGYLNDYESMTIDDPMHFTINLKRPNAVFLGWLSLIFILEKATVAEHEGDDHGQAWLVKNDAGSGPFSVGTVQASGNIALKRFADYWDFDETRASEIIFERIDQSSTQRQALQNGSVDIAYGLTAPDADALKNDANLKVVGLTSPASDYVYLNVQHGPTANLAVREALQLAWDYKGGVDKIRGGFAEVSTGLLPNTVACSPSDTPHAQDLAKARQVLADAGIKDLTLTMNFQPVIPPSQQLATLFQSNLREIGVTLDLVPIGFPDYLKKLSDPEQIPQMMLATEGVPVPDPGSALFKQYTSASIGTTSRTGYSNPEVDQLLTQAEGTADFNERCSIYKQAQELIIADRPVVNLMTIDALVGYRSDLTGIALNPTARPIRVSDIRMK